MPLGHHHRKAFFDTCRTALVDNDVPEPGCRVAADEFGRHGPAGDAFAEIQQTPQPLVGQFRFPALVVAGNGLIEQLPQPDIFPGNRNEIEIFVPD